MTAQFKLTFADVAKRDDGAPPAAETLSSLLGALYDLNRHRDAHTLPRKIVSVAVRVIACDSAAFVRVDSATRSFSLVSWPDGAFAGIDQDDAFRLHRRDHPLVAHFSAARDAKAWSLHDLVSRESFQRTQLYRSLYRPQGIEFQLVLLVPYPDRAPRVLALNRQDVPFTGRERQLLEMLWPHLAQAVRSSRAASRQRGLPEIEGLSPGRGVILLDRTGRVELCTEQARVWLTRYCAAGFMRREIRLLPEPIAGWVDQALANRSLISRGIADPIAPLILRRGDQYLAIRLVADHGRGQHLLLMEESPMNTPPDLLLGLGLTPREAEVLAWVAQGKTNRETGMILGLSTRTVQKHLERVFTKLGVESRTAAILKAWQIGRFEDLGARAKAIADRQE